VFWRRPKPKPREQVVPDVSVLAPFVDEDPQDFSELEDSCGKFIDAWLDAGGEPTDDAIIDVYGIWAQSLDARGRDEADFFAWGQPLFIRFRDEVRDLLNGSKP